MPAFQFGTRGYFELLPSSFSAGGVESVRSTNWETSCSRNGCAFGSLWSWEPEGSRRGGVGKVWGSVRHGRREAGDQGGIGEAAVQEVPQMGSVSVSKVV